MEENNVQTTWFKHAMKNGLILGAIHLVVFLILYSFFPSKLTGFSYIFLVLVLNFGFTIYQGIQWRKEIGGFMGYGDAFKYSFALLVFNGLLGTVFSIVFVLIDPSFPELMAQSQLDTITYWADKFGAPEETVEQMRDQFDPDEIIKKYSMSGILTGFGIGLFLYAVGALMMALFVRKNQPEFM